MTTKKPSLNWNSLLLITFLAAYLFVFNEWLFTITKPSFLHELGFPQQLEILLTVSALLAILCLAGLAPLGILSLVPSIKRYKDILIKLGSVLPAMIFATLLLFLIDNFTYTVFKFGIVSSTGWIRGLYGVGFILGIILCYWRILSNLAGLSRKNRILGVERKMLISLLAGILLVSLSFLLLFEQTVASASVFMSTAAGRQQPHILLVTSDGVNASHMSLYGYVRETTPHIEELAESSLVAENAFANSAKTSGSVISMYTGKYPATTGMLFPPNVLEGDDSYQHLPGILRAHGYKTVQITTPYYLDAREFNVLEGFDEVKTSGFLHSKYLNILSKFLPNDKALFIDTTFNRVVDHIRHILFFETMINPYLLVAEGSGQVKSLQDIERMEYLKDEIRSARGPVFVHVHLMVTHGPKYKPRIQVFSTGQSIHSQGLWTWDLYDDSILDFDKSVGDLIDFLTALDILDNTVIIVGSDHGQIWDPLKRLPLIIRFPHGQYAGTIQTNVHNLDIGPTILDYIGIDQPSWMAGKSLIAGKLEQRPIFTLSAIDPEDLFSNIDKVFVTEEEVTSRSDDLYVSTLVYCQKWYKLDFFFRIWESGPVEGSTTVCPPGSEITDEQAYRLLEGHLWENGYYFPALDEDLH